MSARPTRRKARKRAPESVWLAVHTCGAFHCSRDASGAAHAGRARMDVCCSKGGHPFEVIEYKQAAPVVASPATPSSRKEPVRLRVLMKRLGRRVAGCKRCELAKTRQRTVFARGNPEAAVCFVGEAPGAEEDALGKPFVGRAGKLLDAMIAEMGLSPEKDVYVCNIIKCRPPENRRPAPDEIEACSVHLHEQLSLWARLADDEPFRPTGRRRVIVAMGKTAIAALLDTNAAVTELRGKWRLYRGRTMVMPTYHPAFLMRPFKSQARCRQEAANDLLLVARELGLDAPAHRPRRPQPYLVPEADDPS